MEPANLFLSAINPENFQGNTSLVVERLMIDGPLSRAALAQRVGLAKPTISRLVQGLLDVSYLRETGIVHREKGRPGVLLQINPDTGFILAAEIRVDFFSVVLSNFQTEILWRHEEHILPESRPEEVLSRVVAALKQACNQRSKSGLPILGLMVGISGLLDRSTGELLLSAARGWQQIPLQRLLAQQFDFPVYIENNACLAALSESYFGAAREANFELYLDLGVDLNAGFLLNRRAFTGATGFSGQVAHMSIDPQGPACPCGGHGCWEIFISQQAVFDRVREAVNQGQPSCLQAIVDSSSETLSLFRVLEAARDGDRVAQAVFEKTGWYLGLGLVNLLHLLNPDRIVLGGVLSAAHEFLLPPALAVVQERALRWPREAAQIVLAKNGRDACLTGGVAAIQRQVVSSLPREVRRSALSIQE